MTNTSTCGKFVYQVYLALFLSRSERRLWANRKRFADSPHNIQWTTKYSGGCLEHRLPESCPYQGQCIARGQCIGLKGQLPLIHEMIQTNMVAGVCASVSRSAYDQHTTP